MIAAAVVVGHQADAGRLAIAGLAGSFEAVRSVADYPPVFADSGLVAVGSARVVDSGLVAVESARVVDSGLVAVESARVADSGLVAVEFARVVDSALEVGSCSVAEKTDSSVVADRIFADFAPAVAEIDLGSRPRDLQIADFGLRLVRPGAHPRHGPPFANTPGCLFPKT